MPAMKLTPNAAMRARDVSRPRPEHLAEAEAAEAKGNAGRAGPALDAVETGRADMDGVAEDGQAGRPGFPRRRRGARDVTRRGRPSR
jgi:hypothetical protein